LHHNTGVETTIDLPIGQWVHLAFTLANYSSPETTVDSNINPEVKLGTALSKDGYNMSLSTLGQQNLISGNSDEIINLKRKFPVREGVQYAISIYVNGKLDINIQFPMLVIGNDSPLELFKDESFQGNSILYLTSYFNNS